MEYRFFDPDEVPEFTTNAFFEGHDWIPGYVQTGHAERLAMCAHMVKDHALPDDTVTDLGCGDGSLLGMLPPELTTWGYDLGKANGAAAADAQLDVRYGDITKLDDLELGSFVICTEVLEHMLDPRRWLTALRAKSGIRKLLVSSPCNETPEWHYEHHAWAWDLIGYTQMLIDTGWLPYDQRTAFAGPYAFQAVVAA